MTKDARTGIQPRTRTLLLAAAVGLGVYACGWFAYRFSFSPADVCVLWPGNGLLLAAFVLRDKREWPVLAAAGLVGNMVADIGWSRSALVAASGSTVNVVEALVAAWLLVRLLGPRFGLNSRHEAMTFVGVGVLASNALTACLGALVLTHGSGRDLATAWLTWWIGDGMGTLIVAPTVLSWAYAWRHGDEILGRRSGVKAAVTLVIIAGVAYALHSYRAGPAFNGEPYIVFPLLIWAALRFGPCGASTAALLVSAATVWNLSLGRGPFAGSEPSRIVELVSVYCYLGLAALSSMIPAAVMRERERLGQQLREAQSRLQQAEKLEAVGSLAGGIAHDFNNLLTIILGSSDLALWRLQPTDPLREDIGAIRAAAERAAALTRQLLVFSRRDVPQPQILRPREIVTAAADMLRRLIGEDIRLAIAIADRVGPVRADASQLEQVVVNLAVNARDAMPQGGRIDIELADVEVSAARAEREPRLAAGRYVMLAVTDTGTGMSADTQQRIFDPFFTTKPPGKGTGLGLATVYGIVRESGGQIFVRSELGRGSQFEVYLPQAEGEPERTRAGPPIEAPEEPAGLPHTR